MKLLVPGLLLLILASCSLPETTTRPSGEDLPDPLERGEIRFFIMSDLNSSYGSTDYQWQVDSTVVWLPRYAPDMVLSAGDLVAGQLRSLSDDEIEAMWDGFERHIADSLLAYNLPYAPAMGNHDGSSAHPDFQRERDMAKDFFRRESHTRGIDFVDQANFPFWYSFEIGDIFFVVWDATSASIPEENMAWLQEQLSSDRAQNASMRMLMGHLALYPVAVDRNRHGELLNTPDSLLNMMEEHDVHTYISGHNHAYYPGKRGSVDFLSTGATGSGPRQILGNPEESKHTFTVMDVWPDEGRTVYTTVNARTGETIEKHELPVYTTGVNGYLLRRDLGMPAGFAGNLIKSPLHHGGEEYAGGFEGQLEDGILEISGSFSPDRPSDIYAEIGRGPIFEEDSVYARTRLSNACKKTRSVLRNRQDQGARRPKKRSVQSVHEHFLDERNADIGVFLETLSNAEGTTDFELTLEPDRFQREQLKAGLLHVAIRDGNRDHLMYKGQILNQGNTAPHSPGLPDLEWMEEDLHVTWHARHDPDNDPVHYVIQISETPGFEQIRYSFRASAGTDHQVINGFRRLISDGNGYIRIIATDGKHTEAGNATEIP